MEHASDSNIDARSRIAVDLDEVTADTVSKRLQRYRLDYGEELTRDQIHGKQIRDAIPSDRSKAVEACLDEPGFSRDIPIMPGARAVLEELATRFDILIATSAMDHPVSLYDRYLWLQEFLPFLSDRNYMFCGSKRYIRADYLVDDSPRNLDLFAGTGILFHAHHNIHESRFPRMRNWEEVRSYFLAQ